jgi:predicted ATPase
MGGHVAKKLGDGLLALFGYPVAQENDAERAARAALAIQRALAELNRKNAAGKPELKARIGLETGPAVVDAAGEIYGDVANVAARVQALAEPGAVLVTARVQRLVAGLFVAEERGTHTLKGVPEPTALFRLVRASGGGRRSSGRQLTPLVGRDDEMAMLLRRWERARQGDGQLVMIVGEPGLGKSRLIEEFHARLRDTPHTWVEWSCSQLLQNTPLHPIAEWGRLRFGGADVPAERRLADLESSLAQVELDPAENVSLLAPLLDIPLPPERAPTLAPDELRRRQLVALTNWVTEGAKVQPIVLAFEDLHWADPTTLDVLRGIAERGALAPLFVVATTRPEFRPPWGMRSHHGTISLAPLDRAQVRDMVAELSARHALPREVVEDVAARTGGVPLFVEEVTRLLLERGEQGGGIQAIPPTLQQSLMARLDRLGPAREVAQIGSVIGRGFSYGILRDVAGMEDAPLQAALEKLADADIVLVQGLPPGSDYRFKHALIQDAAYENLLKSRRQVLHRRVAEILRDCFAVTAEAEPEALAYHFTQAGMTDAAIEWWGKAGDQALRRSAFQEAISHLGKAIELADKAGEAASHAAALVTPPGQRLKLQTSLANALLQARGMHSAEAREAFSRARKLAGGIDDPLQRFSSYYGLWVGGYTRGEKLTMTEAAEALLKEAESRPDTAEASIAHRIYGVTCWVLGGDVAIARDHLQKSVALYRPERDRELAHRFAQDIGVSAMVYFSLLEWIFGQHERSRELMTQALVLAGETKHVPTQAYALTHAAVLEMIRLDPGATTRHAEAGLALAHEHGLKLWTVVLPEIIAWARAYTRPTLAEWERVRGGIADLHVQGILTFNDSVNRAWLASGLTDVVRLDEGLAVVDQVIAESERSGLRFFDAESHRIRGEILLKRDPANMAPAEEAFLTAIAIAQQQKAKSFELRAALALAKLYQSTGRPADAHGVLAPALEGFSPTSEFPEIEKAQKLLAALAQTDEAKNAAAARQRQAKLQISYANALIATRGYGAPETTAAFARARKLTAGIADADERFSGLYGVWVGSYTRGEVARMRELADAFLQEAERQPSTPEAGVAHRIYAVTRWYEGDYVGARLHYERALELLDRERDRDLAFRFGQDQFVATEVLLALVLWPLGEVTEAAQVIEAALRDAMEGGQIATIAYMHMWAGFMQVIRGDAGRAAQHADSLLTIGRERGLAMFNVAGAFTDGWARWYSGERSEGLSRLRQVIALMRQQNIVATISLVVPALAAAEAEAGNVDSAIATLDDLFDEIERTGQRWMEVEAYRIRGDILLKRDRVNTAPAEEAFLTAIAIAQQQKAKSFELRAALSLAKLYQSTGRPADAYGVLASALEGFSPTSEFPEIEEAQALLATLRAVSV